MDVVLSTFADVRRSYGMERLSPDPSAWDIPPDGVPLLDTHRTGSFRDILGRVRDITFRNGQMIGTAHISNPDAWAAVERGDLRAISIGYAPRSHSDSRDPKTGLVVRTLTKAALREASFTANGADPGATVRTQSMETETVAPEAEVTSATDVAAVRAEIRTICRAANMTAEQADALIDSGATATDARAAAFDTMQSRRPIVTIGRSSEDPAVTRGHQAEALAASFTGAEPSEGARPFMDLGGSLLRHAAVSLTRAGVAGVATMGVDTLATRAMGTTSDFPIVLDDAGSRVLLAGYNNAATPLKQLAIQRDIPDFRDGKFIRTGGLPALKKVTEAGEIKHSTMLEAGESFRLDTYASIFGLSRQVIINDNFGVLGNFASNAGVAAAATERDLLLSLLLAGNGAGPAMSDGQPLFSAAHGNLAAVTDDEDAALHVGSLSTARLAMRNQTGLDGKTRINVAPKFLLVSADLETTGEQMLATLAAAKVDDQNPFAGKLTLLVEAGLEPGSWYVFADPAAVPTLAYGYLSSAPGPQLASRDGWEVLGREWRVVLDFGCGAIDWRGAYRNPGAEI